MKHYRCMNPKCRFFNSSTSSKHCECKSIRKYPRSKKRKEEKRK